MKILNLSYLNKKHINKYKRCFDFINMHEGR